MRRVWAGAFPGAWCCGPWQGGWDRDRSRVLPGHSLQVWSRRPSAGFTVVCIPGALTSCLKLKWCGPGVPQCALRLGHFGINARTVVSTDQRVGGGFPVCTGCVPGGTAGAGLG